MKNTIYSRFKEVTEKHPDSPAIVEDGRSVSYAELDLLADRIATKIGFGAHRLVGIVMSHGIEQIAAMLGVLKTGAGYIPAEPDLPIARRKYMMETAGVRLVIDDSFCRDLPTVQDSRVDMSEPDGVAYILFTSGTTGRPKGVIVENHSVVNYTEAFEKEMKIGPGDVMLQYSVCSFDIFVEEVFATILNGATIAIPSAGVHDGPLELLMDFCRRHKVTILDGFPYFVEKINRQSELLPQSVKLIISGGDVIRANYISRLRNKGIRIFNTFGPSETTVCSNYFRIDSAEPLPDGTFPVGKAVKGVVVRILDENLKPVRPGEIGEICIWGEGVSRGYLGNPPEQSNFVKDYEGNRFYRSGDMGYEMADGNIVFLHRRDEQVMILGQRVEPEEVENVLNEYGGIEKGIVRAFFDERNLAYIVAYLVPEKDFSLIELKAWLRSRLPEFMIPDYFVALSDIPVTRRGKVDMERLPRILKD